MAHADPVPSLSPSVARNRFPLQLGPLYGPAPASSLLSAAITSPSPSVDVFGRVMELCPSPEEASWASGLQPPAAPTSISTARQPTVASPLSAPHSVSSQRLSPAPTREGSFSSSSSSSSTLSTSPPPVPLTSSIGRKVASNLQLFKETESDNVDTQRRRSLSRQPTSTAGILTGDSQEQLPLTPPNEEEEEVRETQFVKRAAWPDREAAAVRRGKSTTASTRRATSNISTSHKDRERRSVDKNIARREQSLSSAKESSRDLADWRQDTFERGRTRSRNGSFGTDDGEKEQEQWARPASLSKDSTVLQRPPIPHRDSTISVKMFPSVLGQQRASTPGHNRKPSVTFSLAEGEARPLDDAGTSKDVSSTTPTDSQAPRAVSPVQETTPPPPYPRVDTSIPSPGLESPWSSDSESAWDTASMASSVATTTSPSNEHRDPTGVHHSRRRRDSRDTLGARGASLSRHNDKDGAQDDDLDVPDEDDEAAYGTLDELEPPLPNVPLKPFRNQVGGHSAIYKFTKRAVCKVRNTHKRCKLLTSFSLSCPVKICFMRPSRVKPLRSWVSFLVISGSCWSTTVKYASRAPRSSIQPLK